MSTDGTEGSAGRPAVAVVGAGVSGLTAAYLLQRTHDVTLYEGQDRLGGHAHTHDLPGRGGAKVGVDSGFIVHNDRTYPQLRKLFAELGVEVAPTKMSMSVRCEGCGLEYAGGRGARAVFAQPRRAASPRFLTMLAQVERFNRRARRYLAETGPDDLATLGQFLANGGFSSYFVRHYALAFVSCVWSTGHADALRYPARYLFAFLDHHGLLAVAGRDSWATVVGGSRSYVNRLAATLPAIRVGVAVRGVTRKPDGVEVHDDADDLRTFDRVVLATHADEALALLTDPTDLEQEVLDAFTYSRNETVLHTDASVLPSAPAARASWNYLLRGCDADEDRVLVSYWMNHLQHLDSDVDYLVTLNPADRPAADQVVARMTYTHPVYTPRAVAAQRRLPELATGSTVFAGAYHGWGFHEDGCQSGVAAAAHFGVTW